MGVVEEDTLFREPLDVRRDDLARVSVWVGKQPRVQVVHDQQEDVHRMLPLRGNGGGGYDKRNHREATHDQL